MGFALACYEGNMNNLEEQDLVGNPPVVELRPGESHDFSAPLACGVKNQCDNLFNISRVPQKPPHANLTLNSKIIKGDDCPTPCTKPPEPECEFGPAIYDKSSCTWTCPPCVMPPPPECQFGDAVPEGCGWRCPPCILEDPPECEHGPAIGNPETCEWVCPPCTLPPPPECEYGPPTPHPDVCEWTCPPCPVLECEENFVFNPKTCQCECPIVECPPDTHMHPEECKCYCNPDPITRECDEQQWNEVTCEWEGECVCEPEGEPECPEQEWDEELCEWVGDCPCQFSITHPLRQVFCHENIPGPVAECAHFAPGTVPIWSGPAFITAQMDADVVIAKKGGGPVCGNDKRYKIFEDVQLSDPLPGIGGWSHTTYCNCDEPQ
jgi:hypothetical protein